MAKQAGQALTLDPKMVPADVHGVDITEKTFFTGMRAASWPWAVDGQCIGTCQGLGSMGMSTGGSLDRAMLMTPVRQKCAAQGTLSLVNGTITFAAQSIQIGTVGVTDSGTTVGFPLTYGNLTATDSTFGKGGAPYQSFAMLVTGVKTRPVEVIQIPTVLNTTTYRSKASYLPANGMNAALFEMLGDNATMSSTFPDFPITTQFDIICTFGDPKGYRDARMTMRSAESVVLDGFMPIACGYVIGSKDQNQATFTVAMFDHTKVIENDPGDGFSGTTAGGTDPGVALSATILLVFEISFVGVAICPCVAEVCLPG